MESKTMRLKEIADPKLKHKIMRAIDRMPDDAPEVDKILQYIKGTLHQGNLDKFFSESGIESRLNDPRAYTFFKDSVTNLKSSLEEKINMLVLMKDPKNLITNDVFTENNTGNILDHIGDRLKSNRVFQALATPVWKFTIGGQGGMGPGELFVALFSGGSLQPNKKGKDAPGGDVNINGLAVELKSGGVVSPHKGKYVVVDSLNDNIKSKADKLGLTKKYPELAALLAKKGKGSGTNFEGGWLPLFFKLYAKEKGEPEALALFTNYLKKIYASIPDGVIHEMFNRLGNGATELLVPTIFSMCKAAYKWDSIFVAGPNLDYCNLVTFDEGFPPGLNYKVKLKRGKDSNGTADGYMVVSYGEPVPADDDSKDDDVVTVDVKPEKTSKKSPTKKPANPDLFSEPATDQKDDMAQKQAEASADDQFVQKLQDPNNPLTQAWRKYTGDRVAAKDEILNLIMAGKSDQELAQDLENTIYESEIRRMRQLIS